MFSLSMALSRWRRSAMLRPSSPERAASRRSSSAPSAVSCSLRLPALASSVLRRALSTSSAFAESTVFMYSPFDTQPPKTSGMTASTARAMRDFCIRCLLVGETGDVPAPRLWQGAPRRTNLSLRDVSGEREPVQEPAMTGVVVDGVVLRAPVVPEGERARAPAKPAGELRPRLVAEEIVEQGRAFLLGHAVEAHGVGDVHVERPPAGLR